MKSFVSPYNEEYSKSYDSLWSDNPLWKEETDFVSSLIGSLLQDNTRWLDAGCGTGYHLKQHNTVYRAGFDLSETMLDIAKNNNSNAAFFELHDISKEKKEWNNNWDLVTCIGQPWSYLDNIRLIEKTVRNLYDWTSDNGVCLLIPDDVQNDHELKYNFFINEQIESNYLNALIWTCKTKAGDHDYLIYPLLDQWIRWFSLYFSEIRIEYKKFYTHTVPRTYIICSKKKLIPTIEQPNIFIGEFKLEDIVDKYGWDNLTNSNLFS